MAANTRDIRRRIKSVKNTSQITKAMQMVAAAKMRKAQQIAIAGRSYAELLAQVLKSVAGGVEEGVHPLLTARDVKRELVLVISTDKGLCGALNTNLFREVSKFDPAKTVFVAAGRKATQFLTRTGRELVAEFPLRDSPSFLETKAAAKFCMEKFTSGEVDKVTVVFTDFVNTLTQIPKARTILPITSLEVVAGIGGEQEGAIAKSEDTTEYLFEPDITSVLTAVLPHHVYFQVYQMVLDARASEHSARMVAMKSATDNAKQLIKDLTLEYNKVRQAAITTELLEITTAQMALG
ncbi:MAG: F-type H+-transporting ATPase subunit gamma [Chthoniobacter sp.]|jgi:F-type H+-transporting ATPase subunit gamma|nr:F-type H+-transporting ATPase subunit gamma [Chthoniobacter sp.]